MAMETPWLSPQQLDARQMAFPFAPEASFPISVGAIVFLTRTLLGQKVSSILLRKKYRRAVLKYAGLK